MSVRSIWWAAAIPGAEAPFDTAHLRVFYPAKPTGSDAERLSGVFPADPVGAPYPVAVIVSGVNVGQEAYRWLAVELASRGYVAVTYDWVGELFGGLKGITPGVELAAAKPDAYGTRATTPSVPVILDALKTMTGPVAGLLDLDNVALIGHSAGGTVILQSARFFPTVKAVAAYGTHTMVATMLGWPAGTVLPAQVDSPVLLMNGENDGVINGSADRYGSSPEKRDPISRTFDEALPDAGGDNVQVTFSGANHFGIVHPVDETAARAFLDLPAETDPAATRAALADVTTAFLDVHLRGASGDVLDKALQNPDIAGIRRR
ncbi:dienelactone hydrolase [Actinoplanes lutulentus]|uniref:Dienelactone hydrolase n=1 Tax=Actinoplanes lutulentus TaxID=1287878 RepID=A0A327ZJB2_9ACTN|nr:dienelactone hydrolase family protein [Actinoplanes lutulentus]MBB2944407.1 dienelactone hydrolase [Actinoplanes lutulentus]RAK42361.1 dienelactone hydrolase [Actinoplanes lutulentus]